MFRRCVLFLPFIVVALCNQDEFLRCKPKKGCNITQCYPLPGENENGVSASKDYEYPILCQHQDNRSSTTELQKQFKELLSKFVEIQEENAEFKRELNEQQTVTDNLQRENSEMKALLMKLITRLQNALNAWTPWVQWSLCSKTCESGEQTRTRTCNAAFGCIGNSEERVFCNTQDCPAWGQWKQWSTCSRTCGTGEKTRTRTCENGTGCIGDSEQNGICNTRHCPVWAEWEEWSTCSRTCGSGERTRTRLCNNGPGCIGSSEEEGICNTPYCPEWSEWEQWTTCSKTCQLGERKRTRICSNGPGCIGNMVDEEICSTQDCPPDIANECDDGVIYNGKCYFVILHLALDITYDQRESICNDAGGTIAGIWNKQHQTLIEIYVRFKMRNPDHHNEVTWIWLSMTYDDSTKTLKMPNGKSFPSTTFRWYPGSPRSDTTHTAVKILVNKDRNEINQGLFKHPSSSNARGVLCVK